MSFFSRLAAAGMLAGVLSVSPVHAQQQDTTTSNAATPSTATSNSSTPYTDTSSASHEDRRGFDWGWLGLLGLFGLLGLRKPANLAYQDRERTYQDRTTTR